jgi:breast cancer 2 susceptibility protein
VSTLNKLTPDGGVVGVIDVVVLKVYPVAFVEFVVGEDGEKRRDGPWNETEEARLVERWKVRFGDFRSSLEID